MRQRLGVGDIVNRDEFDLTIAKRGAKNISADAPEAVDANFNRHSVRPPVAVYTRHRGTWTAITSPDETWKRNCKIMPGCQQCQASIPLRVWHAHPARESRAGRPWH